MSQTSAVLVKNPVLDPALDFYRLRRDGIGFIAQMGSRRWTDYNVHDPGITILEALSYAITDLASRLGWRIQDILAPQVAPASGPPYPNQAFFTARNILTVNPVTPNDFRRLLIDLRTVRNAWLLCKECACDGSYLAYCDKDALVLSYTPPGDRTLTALRVAPRGLYDVLLELEADAQAGDLNDRKVEYRSMFHDDAGAHVTIMELRFPDISLTSRKQWEVFLDADLSDDSKFTVKLTGLAAVKDFDVFTEFDNDTDRDSYIRKNWRTIFYVSFEIDLIPSGDTIKIENAALRLISDVAAKNATTADALGRTLVTAGFIQHYQTKEKLARDAVEGASKTLREHRNLDEDYCLVMTVGIEEVAVCADVEVAPDADIEEMQARIWFAIEQYFNPAIPFHTLQELLDAGQLVEDTFDGPELSAGFIRQDELAQASLRSTLRVSDILNLLMDIPGIIAVNKLMLTKYDSEGNAVRGAADPTYDAAGQPIFDASKLSASWLLFISQRSEPRLYLNISRFLFYKNGLPFLPRMDEATDTLNQLRGSAQQPKNYNAKNDLDIPPGNFSNPEDYFPVQHSLPTAYGVGPEGLPSTANDARRALARQLKAYLLVFEQLLGDDLAQLAHTADLFSLDPGIEHTYFPHLFDNNAIAGYSDIAKASLTQTALQNLLETKSEFLQRRNRFLDHLLARFGEDFNEYVLLLTNVAGDRVAEPQLIQSKIAFLKAYPQISHDRGRAFDYRYKPAVDGTANPHQPAMPCWPQNFPCIKRRILLLLGYPDLAFEWSKTGEGGGTFTLSFQLKDGSGDSWFAGELEVTAATQSEAELTAYRTVIERMTGADSDAYDIVPAGGKFRLVLFDDSHAELGECQLDTKAAALDREQQLMAWSANARCIVVEHLLLRPKFPGDALFPACCEGSCATCGDEDPYSFRLTFVMPGWVPQYTDNLDLRHFAERTIQQETPSHLLGKTCWVGNDGFTENPCDDVIGQVADLLIAGGLTAYGVPPSSDEACACANAIYNSFTSVFGKWYEDKTLDFMTEDALATIIAAEFAANVKPEDLTCTTVLDDALWAKVQALMASHFVQIALYGWQFERFEKAWCEWLQANAAIDWTEERLLARIEAILEANLTSKAKDSAVCECAAGILTGYGVKFYEWLQTNLADGNSFANLTVFAAPPIELCPDMTFKPGTAESIAELLGDRYGAYKEVSYRLWVVLNLLSKLRSTYPGATLHDCDDGSDQNPVRLDNTALGNYPIRAHLP